MAAILPGDIVTRLLHAPGAAETATARRASVPPAPDGAAAGFSALLGQDGVAPATPPRAERTPDAYARFEAMVLQTFVQSMLPSEAEDVFGKGLSGEMWRSLMAEKIAGVMAERGGIGIAEMLRRQHMPAGEAGGSGN